MHIRIYRGEILNVKVTVTKVTNCRSGYLRQREKTAPSSGRLNACQDIMNLEQHRRKQEEQHGQDNKLDHRERPRGSRRGFAFVISILTHRDGGIIDRLTGAVLCSLLSTGIFYGLTALMPTCPPEAAVAIGSFVGFYGVDEVKRLVMDRVKNLIRGGNDREDKP